MQRYPHEYPLSDTKTATFFELIPASSGTEAGDLTLFAVGICTYASLLFTMFYAKGDSAKSINLILDGGIRRFFLSYLFGEGRTAERTQYH